MVIVITVQVMSKFNMFYVYIKNIQIKIHQQVNAFFMASKSLSLLRTINNGEYISFI